MAIGGLYKSRYISFSDVVGKALGLVFHIGMHTGENTRTGEIV